MGNNDKKIERALSEASERYAELIILRTTIQAIPYIGGPLDTLLGGKGAKIQQQRVEDFLAKLDERLSKLEGYDELAPSEELLDLLQSTFDGVAKTRSAEKRKQFAIIISNKVKNEAPWEEAETATRLLKELDEIHIKLLLVAVKTPTCSSPFENLRVISLSDKPYGKDDKKKPLVLMGVFPGYTRDTLRMVCSELVSRGLIYDEGVGRASTKAMEYFVATDLARWLLRWISE